MGKVILIIALCSASLWSCEKDSVDPVYITVVVHVLVHKWKVLSIENQTDIEKPKGNYIFQFYDAERYSLALDDIIDVNTCGGQYKTAGDGNSFIIEYCACTKVCCDSDFAEKLIDVTTQVITYRLNADTLTLSGQSEIKLLRLP